MSFNPIFPEPTPHLIHTTAFEAPGPDVLPFGAVTDASLSHHRSPAEDEVKRSPDAASPSIECCEQTGVIEIHDPRLLRSGHEAFCRALVQAAVSLQGASRAEVRLNSSTCLLQFEPGQFDRTELARRVAEAVRAATPAVRDGRGNGNDTEAGWTVLTAFATGGGTLLSAAREDSPESRASAELPSMAPADSGRLAHLAMAAGSFALAVSGLVLPGIPTVPFLIMTGRYAVRVSPAIERLLLAQPWCAALLAQAETPLGSMLEWRSLTKMIGLSALFTTGFLILKPPSAIVIGLELGLMAFLGWRELGQTGQLAVALGGVG
jgi:uncharacterized membrane protein YbaN (DUF454 family)